VPNPGCLFIGHGPKTLPVTWLTGNQIINFSHIKNTHDEVRCKVTWITYNQYSRISVRVNCAAANSSSIFLYRVQRESGVIFGRYSGSWVGLHRISIPNEVGNVYSWFESFIGGKVLSLVRLFGL
jgi:hypothetical protein